MVVISIEKFKLNSKVIEHEAEIPINRILQSKKDLNSKLSIPSLKEQIERLENSKQNLEDQLVKLTATNDHK